MRRKHDMGRASVALASEERAKQAGRDARIRGEAKEANPYKQLPIGHQDHHLWSAWDKGWDDSYTPWWKEQDDK